MSNATQTIARQRDYVKPNLLATLYDLCNDSVLTDCEPSDFYFFLNLKEVGYPIEVCYRQKLKMCYLIHSIAYTIRPDSRSKEWIAGITQRCGITAEYYHSHGGKSTATCPRAPSVRYPQNPK